MVNNWIEEINSEHYKNQITSILNKQEPIDKERLFLVSFLYDQLKWTPIDIYTFIDLYNKWTNFNSKICKRQVFRICDRKKNGFLNYCYENETHYNTTPQCGDTPRSGEPFGFHFFSENKIKGGEEIADVEITKKFAKVDNGHKYYQFVEKTWNKGSGDPIHFLSLESGRILESEDGIKFYDKPEKFLTLPIKKELIHKLGEAFELYPQVSEPEEKKKK